MGYTSAVRKCIHIEIVTKSNLIHEKEWIGDHVYNIAEDMVNPERRSTNGITDTNRKG